MLSSDAVSTMTNPVKGEHVIIDSHGHYTQAPPELRAFRGTQLWSRYRPNRERLAIDDDRVAESLQRNLRHMDDAGIDVLIVSPNAGWMGHDFGTEAISRNWSEVNNDLIAQVVRLFPDRFVPACMLPQSPGVGIEGSVEELERCVVGMGFVGCNINPDVTGGGEPFTPSLADEYWYPLWEKMVELDVPGLVHASQNKNPGVHVLGAHYINTDTASVVELCNSRVFDDFPTLRLIVPHGGGAIPFQWARHQALHHMEKRRPFEEVVRHLYFDTTLYDQPAMELLIKRVGADRVLYASEMLGCGKAVNPQTGKTFDHTLPHLRGISWLDHEDFYNVTVGNARRVFSRAKWPDSPATTR